MIFGQTSVAASPFGPTPLVWAPAWVVALMGAAIVVGGIVYFIRRERRASVAGRLRRDGARRPSEHSADRRA